MMKEEDVVEDGIGDGDVDSSNESDVSLDGKIYASQQAVIECHPVCETVKAVLEKINTLAIEKNYIALLNFLLDRRQPIIAGTSNERQKLLSSVFKLRSGLKRELIKAFFPDDTTDSNKVTEAQEANAYLILNNVFSSKTPSSSKTADRYVSLKNDFSRGGVFPLDYANNNLSAVFCYRRGMLDPKAVSGNVRDLLFAVYRVFSVKYRKVVPSYIANGYQIFCHRIDRLFNLVKKIEGDVFNDVDLLVQQIGVLVSVAQVHDFSIFHLPGQLNSLNYFFDWLRENPGSLYYNKIVSLLGTMLNIGNIFMYVLRCFDNARISIMLKLIKNKSLEFNASKDLLNNLFVRIPYCIAKAKKYKIEPISDDVYTELVNLIELLINNKKDAERLFCGSGSSRFSGCYVPDRNPNQKKTAFERMHDIFSVENNKELCYPKARRCYNSLIFNLFRKKFVSIEAVRVILCGSYLDLCKDFMEHNNLSGVELGVFIGEVVKSGLVKKSVGLFAKTDADIRNEIGVHLGIIDQKSEGIECEIFSANS